ncbi:hypothetical protein R3P38DRAFT_2908671 [Favolaschia claudopus]|uniref:Uncharacterized protein n=1 Tax=Favolaschia claudopus TaxID=2862362 RepID=A0AAW0C8H5_9AGAR
MVTDVPSISPPAAISLCFVALLYGTHLIVFPAALYVLLRKQLTRAILAMLTAVIFMFAMSTVLTVTLWTATILDGTIVGIYFNRGVRARILMWPRNMNLIVADGIVVWRMIVLYHNKILRAGILFLLFSFSALALFNSIGEPADGPFERALILSTTASFLSFGTNLIATAAISWKAWKFRRTNPYSWRTTQSFTAVNKTLILLIETGLLYLTWQLLAAIITYTSSYCDGRTQSCVNVQFAANAIAESTTIVAALYPTSTLVIVGAKKSIADQCGPLPSANEGSRISARSSNGRNASQGVMIIKVPQDAWSGTASVTNPESPNVKSGYV